MISIIGAGPSGCYLAYLLAKKGQKVVLFEEHEEVGCPVQCTGIVTEDIKKLVKLDNNIISNRAAKVHIYSKNNDAEIETNEIILFRDRFDRYLLKMALDAGAKLYKGHKYERFDGKTVYFSSRKSFKTDILVGADGPNSKVAKTNGLWEKRDFYVGMQARVKTKNLRQDSKSYNVYFGSDFPGFFGWIVPENMNSARIGIAAAKNPGIIFERFIKRLGISKKDIIEKQGGIIPVYNPGLKLQKNNVFLIGDAAAMTKATTGGGIIPSMEAARILFDCIINKKDYTAEFRKKIGKSLWAHLKIRHMLDRFDDKDYDILLKYIKNDKVMKILDSITREHPIKLVFKLLFAEPRLLRFGIKFLA
jgi:digeranylgeranylglycerophospholipid reductase